MLKKFTVSNYRSFEKPITLDFTNVRDYQFNEECVKDGLISKGIIYGKNAVGKTNLGMAILDITTMIPPTGFLLKYISNGITLKETGFVNAKSNLEHAQFDYLFQLDEFEIQYVYKKHQADKIHFESLLINGKLLYEINFDTRKSNFDAFENHPELNLLNLDDWQNHNSVLKYILSHTKLSLNHPLSKLKFFISEMVDLDTAFPFARKTEFLIETMIHTENEKLGLVDNFQYFLQSYGIDMKLVVKSTPDGKRELYIDFQDKLLLFREHASSGTLSLVKLFYLITTCYDSTFIYIDEFDASFHFSLSKSMLEEFKKLTNTQIIITTHNTDLMSNKYMRPDCYLLMFPDKIINLADATDRNLRMGHNLETLYQAGEFDYPTSPVGDENE